jgi:flagellar motor protein MotB
MVALVLGAFVLTTGVGCTNQDRLIREHDQLAAQNVELQQKYTRALSEIDALKGENDSLRRQNTELQQALTRAKLGSRTPPVGNGGGSNSGAGANTGFEAISGVESFSSASTITVRMQGDVLFASGKATLNTTSRAALNRIATVLTTKYPGKTITVEGHSDSDPIRKSKWRDNYQLSEARAQAVLDYLATRGVSRASMQVRGYGPDQPVVQGNTAAAKARNRRVEIVVVK